VGHPLHARPVFFQRVKQVEPTIKNEFKISTQPAKDNELNGPIRWVKPVLPSSLLVFKISVNDFWVLFFDKFFILLQRIIVSHSNTVNFH